MKKLIHLKPRINNTNQITMEFGYINPTVYHKLPIKSGKCVVKQSTKGYSYAYHDPHKNTVKIMLRNLYSEHRRNNNPKTALTFKKPIAKDIWEDIKSVLNQIRSSAQ